MADIWEPNGCVEWIRVPSGMGEASFGKEEASSHNARSVEASSLGVHSAEGENEK